MTDAPRFPPLFEGVALDGAIDPFAKAVSMAQLGCDAGTVPYRLSRDTLDAAIVLAPEVPLERAMTMLVVCGIGFSNALGALAPPEVAVHLHWDGRIRVNGGLCGKLSTAAATHDPQSVPDWLVIGLSVPLIPGNPDAPGAMPEQTSLFDEGCVEVDPAALLEAWVRHTLVWINTWETSGSGALHEEWRGMARDIGEQIADPAGGGQGTFLGVDEDFGMLLRSDGKTGLRPLSSLLSR
ncbi:biotin/lipoate--protein ligase family protein [Oceanibium sediminis]|uniref:biotin/lipoate--protein ligase family protein n=1 Tax=Oceanibium sediminis TaxID=2026339 RepID=UPI000DD31FEE|nr:biotin/lipoate--protein ligase family protein [Oceanibium sediminis]